MEEEIEKVFIDIGNQLKKEGYDYQEIINNGDIFIPDMILKNRDLNINQKVYLSVYYMYKKDINKVDKYMLYILKKSAVKRIKKSLCKLKYINKIKINNDEAKQMAIKYSHKGKKCEWCGKECYILQEHHYPISKKDGGREVVNICPNCHYTYHYLLETDIYK